MFFFAVPIQAMNGRCTPSFGYASSVLKNSRFRFFGSVYIKKAPSAFAEGVFLAYSFLVRPIPTRPQAHFTLRSNISLRAAEFHSPKVNFTAKAANLLRSFCHRCLMVGVDLVSAVRAAVEEVDTGMTVEVVRIGNVFGAVRHTVHRACQRSAVGQGSLSERSEGVVCCVVPDSCSSSAASSSARRRLLLNRSRMRRFKSCQLSKSSL